MAISISKAVVQKNTDGTYQVNVIHTDGKTSVVSFTHVPFAQELAAAYADFLNGVVKVSHELAPVTATVDADAKKLLADAKTEATNTKAEVEKLLSEAKVTAAGYIAAAKAEAEKLLADAKAEAEKLLGDAQAKLSATTPAAATKPTTEA